MRKVRLAKYYDFGAPEGNCNACKGSGDGGSRTPIGKSSAKSSTPKSSTSPKSTPKEVDTAGIKSATNRVNKAKTSVDDDIKYIKENSKMDSKALSGVENSIKHNINRIESVSSELEEYKKDNDTAGIKSATNRLNQAKASLDDDIKYIKENSKMDSKALSSIEQSIKQSASTVEAASRDKEESKYGFGYTRVRLAKYYDFQDGPGAPEGNCNACKDGSNGSSSGGDKAAYDKAHDDWWANKPKRDKDGSKTEAWAKTEPNVSEYPEYKKERDAQREAAAKEQKRINEQIKSVPKISEAEARKRIEKELANDTRREERNSIISGLRKEKKQLDNMIAAYDKATTKEEKNKIADEYNSRRNVYNEKVIKTQKDYADLDN
jgi:hypothetical protein